MVYFHAELIRDGVCVLGGCSITYIQSSADDPLYRSKKYLSITVPGKGSEEGSSWVIDLDWVREQPVLEFLEQAFLHPRQADDLLRNQDASGGDHGSVRSVTSPTRPSRGTLGSVRSSASHAPRNPKATVSQRCCFRGASSGPDPEFARDIRGERNRIVGQPTNALSLAAYEVKPLAKCAASSPTWLDNAMTRADLNTDNDYSLWDEEKPTDEQLRTLLRDAYHICGVPDAPKVRGLPSNDGVGKAPGCLKTGTETQAYKQECLRRSSSHSTLVKPSIALAVPTEGTWDGAVPQAASWQKISHSAEAFHHTEEVRPTRVGSAAPDQDLNNLSDEVCRARPSSWGEDGRAYSATASRQGVAVPQVRRGGEPESSRGTQRRSGLTGACHRAHGETIRNESIPPATQVRSPMPAARNRRIPLTIQDESIPPATQARSIPLATQVQSFPLETHVQPIPLATQDETFRAATHDGHVHATTTCGGGCDFGRLQVSPPSEAKHHNQHVQTDNLCGKDCPAISPGVKAVQQPEDYRPEDDPTTPVERAALNLMPFQIEQVQGGRRVIDSTEPAEHIASLVQFTPTFSTSRARPVTLPTYGRDWRPLAIAHPNRFRDHGTVHNTLRYTELTLDQLTEYRNWRNLYNDQIRERLDQVRPSQFTVEDRKFVMDELRTRFLTLRCDRYLEDCKHVPDLPPLDLEEPEPAVGAAPAAVPAPTPRRRMFGPAGTPLGSRHPSDDEAAWDINMSGILDLTSSSPQPNAAVAPSIPATTSDWEGDDDDHRPPRSRPFRTFVWFRKRGGQGEVAHKKKKRGDSRRKRRAAKEAEEAARERDRLLAGGDLLYLDELTRLREAGIQY